MRCTLPCSVSTWVTAPAYDPGVASDLLHQCLAHARSHPRCEAVYLHVITYNVAAIRFYERNGFVRLREINDFYVINDQKWGCFVYIHYLERPPPPPGVFSFSRLAAIIMCDSPHEIPPSSISDPSFPSLTNFV